jgi:hypothetical protein
MAIVGAAIGVTITGAGVAFGYWLTTSSNTAQAVAGVVGPGQTPSGFSVSGRDVSFSWAAATNADAYTISRANVTPSGLSTGVAGACAESVASTSCTDVGLPENGASTTTWTYADTPTLDLWQGTASASSASVDVPGPTLGLGTTSLTTAGGTSSATVTNFFDNEGVTYCVDQSSSCSVGNTLGTATVPASGGTVTTASISVPAGLSVGPHTVYAIGSLGSLPTASITVAAGAANKLAFTPATPGPGTAGSSIPSVAVSVEDAYGNVVTGQNSGSITISVHSGSPQSSFTTGITPVNVTGGEATFSDLVVDTAGSYTFTAAPTGISGVTNPVDSNAFTVNPATANKLVFTTVPSGNQTASATATIGAYQVQEQDALGNPVTAGSDVTVKLSTTSVGTTGNTPFFSTTSGGTSGTSVTIASGHSTSDSFYYSDTKAGTPLLTAQAAEITNNGTTSPTIVGGAPASLSFANCSAHGGSTGTCLPSLAVGGVNGSMNGYVIVLDAFGNPTTVSSASTWSVTLTSNNVEMVVSSSPLTITGPANLSGTAFTVTHMDGSAETATITAHATSGSPGVSDGAMTATN